MTRPVAFLPGPFLAWSMQALLEEHGVRVLEVETASSAPLFAGEWSWPVEVPDEDFGRALEVLAATELRKWLIVQPTPTE